MADTRLMVNSDETIFSVIFRGSVHGFILAEKKSNFNGFRPAYFLRGIDVIGGATVEMPSSFLYHRFIHFADRSLRTFVL